MNIPETTIGVDLAAGRDMPVIMTVLHLPSLGLSVRSDPRGQFVQDDLMEVLRHITFPTRHRKPGLSESEAAELRGLVYWHEAQNRPAP